MAETTKGGTSTTAFSNLTPAQIAALRSQPLTYSQALAVESAQPPPGFTRFRVTHCVNHSDFVAAAEGLMTWQVQQRAGLSVAASSARVVAGAVVLMRLGFGPIALHITCRVVRVEDGADRRGFTYGTLPGHPEVGEESFLLTGDPDGSMDFTISAVSKPASRLARLGGPMTQLVQARITQRYLRALDR